jgi:BlaI family penicillinase repressor
MSKLPRISDAEWAVMKVIWDDSPCPASTIVERLTIQDDSWHPKTVKTLLNRLVKKEALGFAKEGRAYVYRPLVSESDCADEASVSFLEKVYGGSLTPMVAHFVENRKLNNQEIDQLRKMLNERRTP